MTTGTATLTPTLWVPQVYTGAVGRVPQGSTRLPVAACQFGCGAHCHHADVSSKTSPSEQATLRLRAPAIQVKGHQVTVNPNILSRSLPTLAVGKRFSPFAPLVEGQQLNLWQKLVLSPVALYQALTRRNNTAVGRFLKHNISDGCVFKRDEHSTQLSCSEYMAVAIKFYGQSGLLGTLKGVLAGLNRLVRCNPFVLYRYQKTHIPPNDPLWTENFSEKKAMQWQQQPTLDKATSEPLDLAA